MKQKQFIGVSLAGLVSAVLLGTFSSGSAVGQSTINLATLRSSALSKHNTYRNTHQAPAMTASDSLNSGAQSWANQIASSGVFEHSKTSGVGENIYATYTTASSIDAGTLANEAVKSWYDEVENYNYDKPGFSDNTGHFTQVVWKGSTQVGCGAAQGTETIEGTKYNAFYVVCQYTAPGNMSVAFPANVQKP